MGLRLGGEKPAAVLRLVYILGWLPALIAGAAARPAAGTSHVLSGAGEAGLRAGLGLALSLAVLAIAYFGAIRRPPAQRALLVACFGSLLVALAMPVLFSADVYAYAYYGDLARHGRNPYGHGLAPRDDPLAAAALAAWDGHIPPRCVYGPVAVAIAALADVAGAAAGADGQIAAQRLAAAAAYAACVVLALRLVREPRARAALLLNPVVIWSVAEGHNDAAMLALICGGLAVARPRPLIFALAALVKAPAVLLFGTLARNWAMIGALVFVGLGYLPLLIALATDQHDAPAAPAAAAVSAWQSPLGLLAYLAGRGPAVGIALTALGAAIVAVRRLAPGDRTAALALATWFALPNAYPWYALWIVPLAVRRLDSVWSRGLLVASLTGTARAITDAIFRAPTTFDAVSAFHGRMIALEFLPPLGVLAFAALRRRKMVVPIVIVFALALCWLPADAQGVTSVPLMTPLPSPAAASQPTPTSAPAPQPGAPLPAPPTPPAPAPALPAPSPATAPPSATASGPATAPAPAPQIAPATAPAPALQTSPALPPVPVITPTPTPNPYNYVITPTPVPVTSPDGPHIIEVLLNDRQIHAGRPLIVRVLTSPNVVGVEARALGRFIAIPQNSPGLFSLAYMMPGGIPFWLINRNYDIVIAAATADGRQVTVSFTMQLTR